MTTHMRTILLLCIACVVALGFLIYAISHSMSDTPQQAEAFDPVKTLATLNTEDGVNDYLEIENMIGKAMEQYGTKAGFELIDEGERQGLISNDACHGFLHYVGHEAYAENPHDYDALIGIVEGTPCIGGYLHGIEAEIVLKSDNVIADVQDFCVFQREQHVNPGPCYHGVGHAASELYNYNVPKALELCDQLEGGPEDDLTNCYRGVFSEVGNIATGYDGHTGLEVDRKPVAGLDPEEPFAYCATLAERHRSSCISQLLKIELDGIHRKDWFDVCLDPTYDQKTKEICVNISSGVYIRSELSFQETATLPPVVQTYPQDLRRIAMLGSLEAYSGYFADDTPKEWKPFCDTFEGDDRAYCIEIFERTTIDNEAPWMEFDIR